MGQHSTSLILFENRSASSTFDILLYREAHCVSDHFFIRARYHSWIPNNGSRSFPSQVWYWKFPEGRNGVEMCRSIRRTNPPYAELILIKTQDATWPEAQKERTVMTGASREPMRKTPNKNKIRIDPCPPSQTRQIRRTKPFKCSWERLLTCKSFDAVSISWRLVSHAKR